MKLWAAALMAVLAVAQSSARAAGPTPVGGQSIPSRIAADAATYSLPEILGEVGQSKPTAFTGTISRTLPNAGKFVRWGGAYVIAPIVVNEALHWFYEQAKSAAYPEVKSWLYDSSASDSSYPQKIGDWKFENSLCTPASGLLYGRYSTITIDQYGSNGAPNTYKTIYGIFRQKADGGWSYTDVEPDCSTKTLAQVPGAAEAVRDALKGYVEAKPEAIRPYLKPIANENQWKDNPYAEPGCTLDTDGDGFTDCVEFEDQQKGGKGDPNDKDKKPNGAPYETGRETVTRCSGDTCITTTTITYSDGKTASIKVTRTTKTVDNGDGTETTTKTTTTETTNREGETSKETKSEKETKPKDYDKEKNSCIASGGTWGADNTCTPASESTEKEKNCKAQGGTWNPSDSTCTPAKDPDEKKKKCVSAGREWDEINETCKEEKKEDKPEPNECGDMDNVKRIIQHPGSWAKDLIIPCDDVGDIISPITDALKNKFPFSLAASLNGWFQAPTDTNTATKLPDKLGLIPLDWGWLTPLWAIIKGVVGVALWAWFVYWLIDRFTPRPQI